MEQKKITKEKPISLHLMNFEEVLGKLMRVKLKKKKPLIEITKSDLMKKTKWRTSK